MVYNVVGTGLIINQETKKGDSMERKRFIGLLTILFCIALNKNTVSAETLQDDRRGTISVTGTISENYPPDTAEIVFAIENSAMTVAQAIQTNNMISEKVINRLKKLVRAEQGDTIKTTSYSLQPNYEYDQIARKNKFTGYRTINQITLKTKQISSAGKFIDSAVEEGANRVDNINFTLSDNRVFCKPLLQEATERAKSEATIVAQSLDAKIVGIKDVASSCGTEMHRPIYQSGIALDEAMTAKSQVSVEAGAIILLGTVRVVFYLDSK
jgi:hypothetical protein